MIIEAFKSFLAYYGLKIHSEIQKTMTAEEMIDVTLKHILPAYSDDMQKTVNVSELDGIERIFDYGNMSGHMRVDDSKSAAYDLLAMVVGLSFFRVANIPPLNNEDNRYICEDYVRRLIKGC